MAIYSIIMQNNIVETEISQVWLVMINSDKKSVNKINDRHADIILLYNVDAIQKKIVGDARYNIACLSRLESSYVWSNWWFGYNMIEDNNRAQKSLARNTLPKEQTAL